MIDVGVHAIKFVCLCCGKCLSDLNTNWCTDCFASSKSQRAMEEKLSRLEDVAEAAEWLENNSYAKGPYTAGSPIRMMCTGPDDCGCEWCKLEGALKAWRSGQSEKP